MLDITISWSSPWNDESKPRPKQSSDDILPRPRLWYLLRCVTYFRAIAVAKVRDLLPSVDSDHRARPKQQLRRRRRMRPMPELRLLRCVLLLYHLRAKQMLQVQQGASLCGAFSQHVGIFCHGSTASTAVTDAIRSCPLLHSF
jgi:hypothetical protein